MDKLQTVAHRSAMPLLLGAAALVVRPALVRPALVGRAVNRVKHVLNRPSLGEPNCVPQVLDWLNS